MSEQDAALAQIFEDYKVFMESSIGQGKDPGMNLEVRNQNRKEEQYSSCFLISTDDLPTRDHIQMEVERAGLDRKFMPAERGWHMLVLPQKLMSQRGFEQTIKILDAIARMPKPAFTSPQRQSHS